MIGSKSITINWENFVRGMTTGLYDEDGGFAIGTGETDGAHVTVINPLISRGQIHFPPSSTDKSTGLTGEIIASCEDPTTTATRCLVSADTDADARFYTCVSDGTLTARGSEDASQNYFAGRTDIIGYKGDVYVTSDQNIVRWQLPATFDLTFKAFSDTTAPHPALVFEDNAYFGDGNELLRMTSAGGAPAVILTLPANQVITALGIDPGSGKMLISVVDQYNISSTINSAARVLYYDGFSNKPLRVVLVDTMITAFFPVGGTMYIGYGQNLGIWLGSGIKFLRALNVTLDNAQLPYKHRFTNINSTLYVVEKGYLLAYGEVVAGAGYAFWYAYTNLPSGVFTALASVMHIGSGLLAFSYATSKFYTVSMTSSATLDVNGLFHTMLYRFPRSVMFNSVILSFGSAMPTSGTTGTWTLFDFSANGTAYSLPSVATTVPSTTQFESTWPTLKTKAFLLRYTPSQVCPIREITITYTPYE